jgi:hypothetical protein
MIRLVWSMLLQVIDAGVMHAFLIKYPQLTERFDDCDCMAAAAQGRLCASELCSCCARQNAIWQL